MVNGHIKLKPPPTNPPNPRQPRPSPTGSSQSSPVYSSHSQPTASSPNQMSHKILSKGRIKLFSWTCPSIKTFSLMCLFHLLVFWNLLSGVQLNAGGVIVDTNHDTSSSIAVWMSWLYAQHWVCIFSLLSVLEVSIQSGNTWIWI